MLRALRNSLTPVFLIGTLFFWVRFAAAAMVATDVQILPSTLVAGEYANYRIIFDLTDDVSTLTLHFDQHFSLSGITEDDVDLYDDDDVISTASSCAGSEQVAVTFSGNDITFSPCPGDGFTSFNQTSTYTILLGRTATHSGVGTQSVLNPEGARAYAIRIEDSAVWVPITAVDTTSNFSFSVPGSPSEEGGGGGGSGAPSPSPTPTPTPTPDPTPEPEPTPEPVPEPVPEPEPEPAPIPEPAPDPVPDAPPESPVETSPESSVDVDSPAPTSPNDGGGSDSIPSPLPPLLDSIDVVAEFSASWASFAVGGTDIGLPGGIVGTVTVSGIADPEAAVSLRLGDILLVLSRREDGVYVGQLTTPMERTVLRLDVLTRGEVITETSFFTPRYGEVLRTLPDGGVGVLPGALVTPSVRGLSLGEVITNESGRFPAWFVRFGDAGTLMVAADGYIDRRVSIQADGYQFYGEIVLEPYVGPAALEDSPRGQVVSAALQQVLPENIAVAVASLVAVLDSPEAQVVAEAAVPVAVAASVATVATVSTGGFSVLPYLQYLFTSPVLFFSRRRRTVYGTVYHAMTKVPLELVTVRLLRAQDRRLVKSVVTNAQGQYGLPVRDPGEYLLEYQKPGFSFPSQYLKGVQQDGIFADVLTSAQLRVTDRDVFVAPNVPMDPIEVSEAISLRNVRGARWRTRLQYVVAPLGAVAAGVSYVISPTSLGFGLFLTQCVVLGITARVAWPKKPAGWGVVLDKKTGKPVPNAVVRLFESRYNKLIDTVLTDSRGRYALLLGPNVYQTRFDKRGYATEHLAQLDLSARREPAALTERVKLTPTP